MQYRFDQLLNRSGTGAAKYEDRIKHFGGGDVLPLWIADMDLPVPAPVVEAIMQRGEHPIYGYTTRPDSYFEAVCDWQERRHGWKAEPGLCSFNLGVVPAMSALVQQLTKPGDSIVFQTPVYPAFFDVVKNWGRKPVLNPILKNGDRYEMDFELLERQLAQKPALFLLCSPHNPLGRVWTREELERLSQLCIRYGVMVISDEIHADLLLWGNRHIPFASLNAETAANTITCVSATKTFNLAGLQASTTIYPDIKLKQTMDRYWGAMDITRNNCFSQVAVEAAYTQGGEWLDQLLRYLEGNIAYIHQFLEEHIPEVKSFLPESTYLMWLDFRGFGLEADKVKEILTTQAKLGLNDGRSFGGEPGFFRLNAACPRSTLEEAMSRLEKAVPAFRAGR